MTARKIRGAWWVDFRWTHRVGLNVGHRERIRRKSPVDTKRGAEEHERQLRALLHAGEPLNGTDGDMRAPVFSTFAEEFMETYVSANNKKSERDTKESMLRCHIIPRFGKLRIDAIGKREIEAMRAEMRTAGTSAKRINNVTGCLMKILRYAHEVELLEKVPRIEPLKVALPKYRHLDFGEYERLVAAAAHDPQLLAMIRVAGEAGLRKGEVAALTLDDVDFERRKLTVSRNAWFRSGEEHLGSPKGGRSRVVDMTQALTVALRAAACGRADRLFQRDGRPFTPKVMELALNRTCERAGLKPFGWHVLRHTFCSQLAMSGADPKTIQEFAGHANLATTLRYMHLSPRHRRDAIDGLERARAEHAGH